MVCARCVEFISAFGLVSIHNHLLCVMMTIQRRKEDSYAVKIAQLAGVKKVALRVFSIW